MFPVSVIKQWIVDESKIYTINLTIRGPRGHPFGEMIPIQLKVCFPKSSNDEMEVYKLAIKLQDMKLGSFEECTKAAIHANCDEATAIKALTAQQ